MPGIQMSAVEEVLDLVLDRFHKLGRLPRYLNVSHAKFRELVGEVKDIEQHKDNGSWIDLQVVITRPGLPQIQALVEVFPTQQKI